MSYETTPTTTDARWPGATADLDPTPDHGETSYTGHGRLAGKRALITGGDSGIGRAVAIAYAREGAHVVIGHLPEEREDAASTLELVRAEGVTGLGVEVDVRTPAANAALVQQAVAELGGIDILVANAAYQMAQPGGLEDYSPEQVQRVYETNVFGTIWLVQAAHPHLETGASIVVTTSIQAYSPSEALLDYASTKAALNNLVVNLAGELGPEGVRVNAVAPGPIWTPLIPSTMPEDKVKSFGQDTPLGRMGQPVELAGAYVFLASDEASYVSGTVIGVTGGKPVF